MRILLRKRSSGELLARSSQEKWTRSQKEAWGFKRSQEAVETAAKRRLSLEELELVYHHRNREHMRIRLDSQGSTLS